MNESFSSFAPISPSTVPSVPLAPSNAIIGVNERTDEWVYYASRVRPHYERMNSLVGQIAGLLILGQAKGCFDTYFEMSRTPKEQAQACLDELYALSVPITAASHLTHLRKAARQLYQVADDLNVAVRSTHELTLKLAQWLTQLKAITAVLHCAADPVVSMQPVAFEDACACCNVGAAAIS